MLQISINIMFLYYQEVGNMYMYVVLYSEFGGQSAGLLITGLLAQTHLGESFINNFYLVFSPLCLLGQV